MTTETEENHLEEKTGTATYCPEDNKLRLYVGRVPRDEYLALRSEGWTSTPKQACDFVATWTPERRARCLQYTDLIEDEDQSQEDRAADRAERFGEYRDKRTAEATGHADQYDAGPNAHGYQSQARAERAARRHDRQASYACDAWSKAEYWQRRTAGVIAHALYKSTPSVRMGRIKTLEAELRGMVQRWENQGSQPTGNAAEWKTHLELRLAYENQMLEAQGGRAAFVEMVPGGFIGNHQIFKVNKSPATGRVVSVSVKVPKVQSWTYRTHNVAGTNYALSQIDTERLPANAYRAPTDEELKAFNDARAAEKKARPVTKSLLINPTDEDAERLQALLNEHHPRNKFDTQEAPKVSRITQDVFSRNSGGSYSACETAEITGGGYLVSTSYMSRREKHFPAVVKVRMHGRRVIVLTDKPQKPFPIELWHDPRPALLACCVERAAEIREALGKSWSSDWTDEQKTLIEEAQSVGLVNWASMSQFSLTPKGFELLKQQPTTEGCLL